ncbi:putative GTPase [Candidatus Methanoperedens nitroreducens]|uniref:Probable GTP-binding protein EngB n=1 Tax=Candidatus Methanoperedens nitratireducens TaxID=1392998 RepID=A0A062UVN6_9EURY|nr:GTP-binding protein EngB [Candidatus Methanoperedens nitroreducens]KCZ71086.1 putative GTPase [Candidatus Methanoperedens nitroreducens]MDJ1421541.1 GTP-binding protein EngB [Candidatus Methanoperedens sp.]
MKEILFVGRSNVGKSTLIRALTGKKIPVGKHPGVTRKPLRIPYQDFQIVDMPGFGFMSGVSDQGQEAIKDNIVHYIESNAGNIALAVMVVNAGSFAEIVDRWTERGEIPVEVELFEFLHELNIDVIVAANKIDKVGDVDRDSTLDGISQRLGMTPPWRQWIDRIVPVSAKKRDVGRLKEVMQKRLEKVRKNDGVNVLKSFMYF